jgi:2-(1,2-epoxy-1,2-dihydrophenyl)acetyl-CoA isomerase
LLMSRTFETGLNEMFLIEGLGQALGMSSPEFHEGISAMLERRPAEFAAASKRAQKGGEKTTRQPRQKRRKQ